MAGLGPVLSSLSRGEWPLCHDGSLLDPLDALYLLFKNKGRNATAYNECFVPDRFTFAPLRNLLPESPSPFFTPDDLVDTLVCLFIACTVIAVGMSVLKLLWEKMDSRFASISPSHKKWYVVANVSKAFLLGCMCVSSRYWIYAYHSFYLDDLSHQLTAKRCGVLYMATDLVALVMVPKLPHSTIVHHVTTTVIIVLISAVNLSDKGYAGVLGVCKMAVLYGIFSTMPYLVNAYLAFRVLYEKTGWICVLVKASLWTYLLCCACNWTAHLMWLYSLVVSWELSIASVLYLLAFSALVHDDIVLIKWLAKRSSPGAVEESEQKKES